MAPYSPPPRDDDATAWSDKHGVFIARHDAEGKSARRTVLMANGSSITFSGGDEPVRGREITAIPFAPRETITPRSARSWAGPAWAIDRAMPWLMIAATIAFCLFIAWMVATGAALDAAAVRR